jgi:hypothetical protein
MAHNVVVGATNEIPARTPSFFVQHHRVLGKEIFLFAQDTICSAPADFNCQPEYTSS